MHRTIGATDRTQFDGSLGVFQRRQRRPQTVVLTGRVRRICVRCCFNGEAAFVKAVDSNIAATRRQTR